MTASNEYQTIPQAVTAVQFLGKGDPGADGKPGGSFAGREIRYDPTLKANAVLIPTPSGGVPAFAGDWVLTDARGNMSVVSDAAFSRSYQSVAVANQQAADAAALPGMLEKLTEANTALAGATARAESAEAAQAALEARIGTAEAELSAARTAAAPSAEAHAEEGARAQ